MFHFNDEKIISRVREYESEIIRSVKKTEAAIHESDLTDKRIIVRLSYNLYCDMMGKTDAIGGEIDKQRTFHGYPVEVYPGGCREKSYAVYIETASKTFEI